MIKQTTMIHFGLGSVAACYAVDVDGNGVMFCHEDEARPLGTVIDDSEPVNPDDQDVIMLFHSIEGIDNIIKNLTLTRDSMIEHKKMTDAVEAIANNMNFRGKNPGVSLVNGHMD